MVLDVAIDELNTYTELEVWYTEIKKSRVIIGFKLHWSTGSQIAGVTEKQLGLLREVYDEVQSNMFEYLSIKEFEAARRYIIEITDMHLDIKKGLSSKKAEEFIKKSLEDYKQLEKLVELDGKTRDKSIYYNCLVSSEDKNKDSFNQIITEHKVKEVLEKEAISLWEEKRREERMKKTGWFRKEEDSDKRSLFIKKYIDKYFEIYLKKEFDI